ATPQTSPAGAGALPGVGGPDTVWGWAGNWVGSSVTVVAPPICPTSYWDNPLPWPAISGAEPWGLGGADVGCPLPPYMVPSREKSAVFWEMDISWPLHSAHPVGAKFPANMRISPIKGSDIAHSSSADER